MSSVVRVHEELFVNVCEVCGRRGPETHHQELAAQNAAIHDTDFPHLQEPLFDLGTLA
ncbi:hypothetical protein [Leucobacter ruminantium]|uniref:Uncharacterized protein n=1 Tax=Leucobacter ruminantium TaxID=1289170 RepID=A0A939LXE5_9MICO|nr:hypothetical protein [Leucobacter ruminantium]MBO1805861.1 hypothetical protein [Leucobacter ruminantium]